MCFYQKLKKKGHHPYLLNGGDMYVFLGGGMGIPTKKDNKKSSNYCSLRVNSAGKN